MFAETPPSESDRSLAERIHALAENHRDSLQHEAIESRAGTETLTSYARITLESYGRALLETGNAIDHAVELLALSGALDKEDVQAQLRTRLENLARSEDKKDQLVLVDACKHLLFRHRPRSATKR